MARLGTLIRYALADLWRNHLASLASMPLFTVVAGLPFPIYTAERTMISAWTEEIARDVSNREVIVVRGREDDRWLIPEEIDGIASWPETGFLVPEASFSVRSHEWSRLAPGAFRRSRAPSRCRIRERPGPAIRCSGGSARQGTCMRRG